MNNKISKTNSLIDILIIIPLVIVILFIFNSHLFFPIQDQWDFVPLIEKSFQGHVSFGDLFSQHNEHRLFFPRIIMLILARLTGWQTIYEVFFSIILASTFLFILYKQINNKTDRFILPIFSLLVFSVCQWSNWVWGWQLQIFLSILASAAGLFILSNKNNLKSYLIAIVLGIIATLSFANGLLFWITGSLILLLKEKRVPLSWLATTLLVFVFYFLGYKSPGAINIDIVKIIPYTLVYLGSPIIRFSLFGAILMAILGISIQISTVYFLVIKNQVKIDNLLFFLSLSTYSVLSAIITAIARSSTIEQALVSRYVTISTLLWITTFYLLFLCLRTTNQKKLIYSAISGLVILVLVNSIYSYKQAEIKIKEYKKLEHMILQKNQYKVETLKERKLNIFR